MTTRRRLETLPTSLPELLEQLKELDLSQLQELLAGRNGVCEIEVRHGVDPEDLAPRADNVGN